MIPASIPHRHVASLPRKASRGRLTGMPAPAGPHHGRRGEDRWRWLAGSRGGATRGLRWRIISCSRCKQWWWQWQWQRQWQWRQWQWQWQRQRQRQWRWRLWQWQSSIRERWVDAVAIGVRVRRLSASPGPLACACACCVATLGRLPPCDAVHAEISVVE